MRNAIEALGRLDFLVNNAGTSATAEPIAPADLDALTTSSGRRSWPPTCSGRSAARAPLRLRSRRRVVRSATPPRSPAATCRAPAWPMAPAKPALINLTKNLARALAPEARVNAVAPGFVDTEWTRSWPDARKQASIERTLLKRACTPADIAAAIVFLCADASMVTAQTLVVDGGYSL